jgi:phosphopantothenoylcysteine decarboxylase/phosphopantothenate--cysteine ligase
MNKPLRIIIGITGGIAAYKIPELVRIFVKQGAEVKIILTPAARPFVGEESLRTVSNNPVYYDRNPSELHLLYHSSLEHIKLAEWADYLLIAPATSNTIAKITHGTADNLLTTTALSFHGLRLIIAPAMNTEMWLNPATIDNIETLQKRGVIVLPVEEGELACGTSGPGRMLPIEEIANAVFESHAEKPLKGKRVLISSGPTVEPIDAVRVITNRSSGRMGSALADAAKSLGAEVTVVSGPSRAPLPQNVRVIKIQTALEMQAAMEKEFDTCDICIYAAAVADFRPSNVASGKLDRDENGSTIITFVANPDIAKGLGERKKNQYLVGFSLEADGDIERARIKMQKKKCDLMVYNRVETALEKETTEVTLLWENGTNEVLPQSTKGSVAKEILSRITKTVITDQSK